MWNHTQYAELEQVLDKGLEFDEFGGRVARCQKRVSQYYRDDGTSVRRCLRPWERLPACRESWQAGNLSHDHLGERPDFASPQTSEVSEDFGSLAVSFHGPIALRLQSNPARTATLGRLTATGVTRSALAKSVGHAGSPHGTDQNGGLARTGWGHRVRPDPDGVRGPIRTAKDCADHGSDPCGPTPTTHGWG